MDLHYEDWCPACDRQIMPKRIMVHVPPSDSSPPKAISRTKTSTIRWGNSHTKLSVTQPLTKSHTVIDQGPIPLYCSDDCRMADSSCLGGAFPISYNPDCASPLAQPVPHQSPFSCDSEDESTSGSSLDSCPSLSDVIAMSPSMATLAAMYNFPPLPPQPPILPTKPVAQTASVQSNPLNVYQGGVMMAAKRIQAALCTDPVTKRPATRNELPRPQKPIPGWTDGSDAWRRSVYSFSPRSETVATPGAPNKISFAATSSSGVQWTSGDLAVSLTPSSFPAQSRPLHLPCSTQSYTDELYAKYFLPLSRRSELRSALYPNSPSTASSHPSSSLTSTSSHHRRETPLAKPGAEGRLLVPNTTIPPRAYSIPCQSMSTVNMRSPLSCYPSKISEDSMCRTSASMLLRPQTQVRSWSYGNIKTYPVMVPPPKKEKRIETRVVNGDLKEVEVEIEVAQTLKRLFLFH